MHLLCQDDTCEGHRSVAGTTSSEACRFCGLPLEDTDGRVLAQGVPPGTELPADFDAFLSALRDAGAEVVVVELNAVQVGDKLLLSSTAEDGELLDASIVEGREAAAISELLGEEDAGSP